MFAEQAATQGLLDSEHSAKWEIYDPYRQKNILKDCNMNLQQRTLSAARQCRNEPKLKKNLKMEEQSDCKSLKKLLKRLESMPSPQKKQIYIQEQKQSLPTFNSAQLPSKYVSTTNLTQILQKLDLNSEKLMAIPSRLLSQQSQRPSRKSQPKSTTTNVQQQRDRIRSLIKKKMSQKQQFKIRTQKNTMILKQNTAQIIQHKMRKNSSRVRQNCRKLLNLLC